MLKVGVMSFAHPHSETYVEILREMNGVRVMVSDPGPYGEGEERGAVLARRLRVAYADTFEELLEWGPDAVIVASENVKHRDLVEMAAARGAHVLCEKPLATNIQDGEAILAAASAGGVVLMTAFPVRFSPAFLRLKNAYDAGHYGRIVGIHGVNAGKLPSERSWFTDSSLSGGGALVDHIVHIADLVNGLTGVRPKSVTAVTNRLLHDRPGFPETSGIVSIEYDDGMIVAIDCSWSVPDNAPRWGGLEMRVSGTRSSVDIDFFADVFDGFGEAGPYVVEFGRSHDERMLCSFVEAARTGVVAAPDGRAGLDALRIVLAAQASDRTGATVHLENR